MSDSEKPTGFGRGWTGRTKSIERPPIAEINRLASKLERSGRELIDLGQAILGLPPPRGAITQARDFLRQATDTPQGYSPDPGLPELREAIAKHCAETKNIAGAEAGEILVTCGANQAFATALLTITNPGDEIIHFAPGYFDHDFATKLAGCKSREVPLTYDGKRYDLDIHAVAEAIGPSTRCISLVSPANPTGWVADPEAVEALYDLCRRNDLWLISDETYDLLVFPPNVHTSPVRLTGRKRDKIVTIGSFSKVFGLAAWRVGFLHGPRDLVEETIKAQDALVVCAPVVSQKAALGALAAAGTYVPEALTELQKRRDALLHALREAPSIDLIEPQGATFLWARLRSTEKDVQFCRKLLKRSGVVAVPGSAFGSRGRGHVRLSFGNQPALTLLEAGERIKAFLKAKHT